MNSEGIKDECRCGHDKASHYADAEGVWSCLVQGCDKCKKYVHFLKRAMWDGYRWAVVDKHPDNCFCRDCIRSKQ